MTQATLRGAPPIMPPGGDGNGLGAEEFRQIAAMMYSDAGIHLPESKVTLVYSRLIKRLRALGLESFKDYCDLVSGSEGQDERQEMLVALTTNVTSFFREPHHFEHLRSVTLPPLLAAGRRGARVRIWSAGCSCGHEPYSIAMTILALMPDAPDHDIRILASDIDTRVLEEGRIGLYDEATVSRVPRAERLRFFVPQEDGDGQAFAVTESMRRLVSFRELNLVGRWPMKGAFDIIFCRNVLIYFDVPTQERVWSRFAGQLNTDGILYAGHSERMTGQALTQFVGIGLTTYRRTGARRP